MRTAAWNFSPASAARLSRALSAGKIALLAGSLAAFGAAFQAPVPTWPADGKIPDSEKDQYVFLSPDQSSVVIAFPPSQDPNAPRKILTLSLHNRIDAQVGVEIKAAADGFAYRYSLSTTPQSVDSVNVFSIVATADPAIQVAKSRWVGMIAGVDIAKRVGLHYAPPGRFIWWSSPDEEPLRPGSRVDAFALTSSLRPGFTTAYAGQFPAIPSAQMGWGEKVLDQLDPVVDPAWVEKHIITFGPRYRESDPLPNIAQDYLAGIADLIRARRADPASPFIDELSAQLRGISTGNISALTLKSAPASQIETELRQAVTLCLGSR